MEIQTPGGQDLSLSPMRCARGMMPCCSPPKSGGKRKRQPLIISKYIPPRCPVLHTLPKTPSNYAPTKEQETPPKRQKVSGRLSTPAFRTTKPEPSSINDIIRQHCRSRLYVKPLHWTSHHLGLLQCRFKSELESSEDSKSYIYDAYRMLSKEATIFTQKERTLVRQSWGNVTNAFEDFWDTGSNDAGNAIGDLFATFGSQEFCAVFKVPFFFNGKPVQDLRVDALFSHPSHGEMTPSIAYLRLDRISERRQNCRSSSRGWMIENKPHARISEIKQRQITPANRLEDPYIAAVLIGLAQQLRRDFERPQAKCHNDRPSNYEVLSNANIAPSTLQTFGIFSRDSGSEDMLGECLSFRVHVVVYDSPLVMDRRLYLYTADISSKFLDKFDKPSSYSDAGRLDISYSRLPVKTPQAFVSAIEKKMFPRI